MEFPALWAFEDDIKSRSWLDWLTAHTSLMKPLHRYEGLLAVYANRLNFSGIDKRSSTQDDFSLDIYKYQIEQLYHGFDEIFHQWETRGLGLTGLPLRLTFTQNEKEEKLYLITNYKAGWWNNTDCFEFLKNWVSK
jgi:hypothetical protein